MIFRKPNGEIDKFLVVRSLVGGAITCSQVDGKSNFTFHDGQTPPTEEEIDAEIKRLNADYDAKKYQRDRQPEYPNIGDQLDALYHAGVFPKEMADKLKAVKDKYPKPE